MDCFLLFIQYNNDFLSCFSRLLFHLFVVVVVIVGLCCVALVCFCKKCCLILFYFICLNNTKTNADLRKWI